MKIDLNKIIGTHRSQAHDNKTDQLLYVLERKYHITTTVLNEKNLLSFVNNPGHTHKIQSSLQWIKKNKTFTSKSHQANYILTMLEQKKQQSQAF